MLQATIKISSGKGAKRFATSKKIKDYIRYIDSLRVGDPGGEGKKNKYVRTLKRRKVLLAMMAIVERGRVYEITNLLYITLKRAQFSEEDIQCYQIRAQPANS